MASHASSNSSSNSSEARNSSTNNNNGKRLAIWVCVGIVALLIIVGATTFGILRPQKPSFTLDDVSVYALNTSQPGYGSSSPSIMVTITSKNPGHTDINYGGLEVYLSMNDKKTEAVDVEGMLQKPKETSKWTVVLGTKEIANAAQGEKGLISVDIQIQWKMGLVYTPMFKYHVNCPVIINTKPMHLVVDSRCSIH